MTEHEFTLQDRISKIKSINDLYDLESKSYISFSGGKDSTVLHYLIDEALPGNKIPRVYINTGIEFNATISFVNQLSDTDNRIQTVAPSVNIKKVLEQYGYPFKNKLFSHNLHIYQNNGITANVKRFVENNKYGCSKQLQYCFKETLPFSVSEKCCDKIKKIPSLKWAKENNKSINIIGIRKAEGGARNLHSNCTVFKDKQCKTLERFSPLLPVSNDFIEWYISARNIKLCDLYYEPYNFYRQGCKGSPYSLDLQHQLDVMEKYLPSEKKQCEILWKPVYEEYRRIGYRLRKDSPQLSLFGGEA